MTITIKNGRKSAKGIEKPSNGSSSSSRGGGGGDVHGP
jgi:hypothetical protein